MPSVGKLLEPQNVHGRALQLMVTEILDPYEVSLYRSEADSAYVLVAEYGGVGHRTTVPDYMLLGLDPGGTANVLRDSATALRDVMRKTLHDEWGEYPEVAVWASQHTKHQKGRTIPGFVWPLWNKNHPSKKALKTGGIVTKGSEEDVATKTKKVVVKKGAAQAKKTVNRPTCPVHKTTDMKFNPIRAVWECAEAGCKLIARPKTDQADGQVILGKGNVELRLVFTDPGVQPRVVLMSDNNVALDVTDFIDIVTLTQRFDVDSKIRQAKQQGVSITRTAANQVPLRMSLAILGLDNV